MSHVSERARNRGETLGWAAVALGAGFLVGVVLGEVFGGVSTARIRRAVTRWSGGPARPQPSSPGEAAARIQDTLRTDPILGVCRLEVLRVGRGAVELHGWVSGRELRARAHRMAVAAAGETTVTNRVLVRGEDDRTGPREHEPLDTPRTA